MIPDPSVLTFSHEVATPESCDFPALLVGVFEGLTKPEGVLARMAKVCEAPVQDLIDCGEISGAFSEFTLIHVRPGKPFRRLIVMGLGSRELFDVDRIRSITARAVRTLRKVGCPRVAVVPSDFPAELTQTVESLTVGALLGLYKFVHYLENDTSAYRRPFLEVRCLHDDKAALKKAAVASERGQILGWSTNYARNLGNEPANHCTPATLAAEAKRLGKYNGFTVTVHDEAKLRKLGMGGILAVGAAGATPPRLIEMWWKKGGASAPTVALVGKGITFDAGGLCIKPGDNMHTMKFDMCGAAAVLGAMRAIAQLELPINVLGLIPTAENIIDARGFKPSDIVTLFGGVNVEIRDTDAEGRLLLGDALAYAASKKVDAMLDIATLTGGVVRALGHCGSGVMGTNQFLVDELVAAGRRAAEKLWQLPLWSDYRIHLKSNVAAIANCNQSPVASASTAATFLRTFVGDTPWVHMDIAGTASIDDDTTTYVHKPYLPKRGATGVGVRTMVRFLERLVDVSRGKRTSLRKLVEAGRGDTE